MNKALWGGVFFFIFSVDAKNVDFKLEAVPLPKAISLIYDEVLQKPYMLDPNLANDLSLMSFHATEKQDFNQFIIRYFENMNIRVYEKQGVVYLVKVKPPEPKVIKQSFVYNPIHRDVDYLQGFLKSEGEIAANGDKLVFYGTKEEIVRVQRVLSSVDTPSRELVVTGYVFEVQDIEKEGSGINLLAKLLSGKLGINIGIKQNYENFITINTGNLDAMIELFRTDSRFHVVSSPTLRVKSGSKGNFSVGSDVPVLSSVTYQDGRPVQSVEYRSSGVIFDIQPTIKSQAIDLKIQQQLSNFVKTDTGVNQSPTLIKRDIVTDVTVKSGDVIVLGGLAENKLEEGGTGFSFLPKGFLSGKSTSRTKTDIVVLLQVKVI
ncbi:type II secretion system protein GspD [Arsenophonus nasoniae]|uniref:Type II secretion system protein D n=1 Tax=Arsenophonus nasoniae TaxID=638 RepID=A0A4P7KPM1_9GAMM|nr:type II secretion system protein GspD [Arsenophonus nasoniae]QBY41885.1 Putative type II secretion system protein D [Arsenophonus nasoniae]WGM06102.1 type II secretion system protein GspD [Arsenophonus nasoniae]WGM11064.1 type II secretion system protein GspD [Arsenophonus nasoniae]WGM15766.1 type II secretion system protein GspD [Arsenophonus nasoniae]